MRAIRLLQSFQFQVNNTQGEIVGITDIVDGGLAQIAGLQVVIADGFTIVGFTLDDETFIPPATGILTSFVVGEELIGEQLCISNAEFLEYPSGLLVPVTVPTCAELANVNSVSLSQVSPSGEVTVSVSFEFSLSSFQFSIQESATGAPVEIVAAGGGILDIPDSLFIEVLEDNMVIVFSIASPATVVPPFTGTLVVLTVDEALAGKFLRNSFASC